MVEGQSRDNTSGKADSYLLFGAAGLIVYCLILTALAGDIGFDGDDWQVLSWPYWHSFPGSWLGYTREFLRPVEGLYWIGMFELFGFNNTAFHLLSLLLLAGSCCLMAVCLSKAFPDDRTFVSISMLFAFFLPTVSSITYLVFTDNSRLSLLLFWASVLAFQIWTERSAPWRGLILPVFIYVLSFLTYEAPSFLVFVVPMLCLPVHKLCVNRLSDKEFYLRLGIGIFAGFATALAIRFLFLKGGAVEHVSIVPPLQLLWAYLGLLPFYIAAPFTSIPSDLWIWALGAGVAAWATSLLFIFNSVRRSKSDSKDDLHRHRKVLYKLVLGLTILLLGMLPYQLAGYGLAHPGVVDTLLAKWGFAAAGHPNSFNFNEASRVYSSASCGLAILFAALLCAWSSNKARLAAKIGAVAALGFMVMFHAGLSIDWKEAAAIRNGLVKSLVEHVPDVKPRTNFVFLNLESYHKRAAIIRGWGGLRALIRILYDDPTLGAWYLYPSASEWPNSSLQQAIVLRTGFVTRGIEMNEPASHDSLLVFTRSGTNMVLLDKISSDDGLTVTGIDWKGARSIHSNADRIMWWSDMSMNPRRPDRNSCTTGLISSLRLSGIRPAFMSARRWSSPLRVKAMGKLLLRK
ncbi:MAG TPA: hypothetical protein VMC85_05085 [Desulfomonilaceae bacterium]|nr:hypothetical protein [Desulfomonilaceae bacterium]